MKILLVLTLSLISMSSFAKSNQEYVFCTMDTGNGDAHMKTIRIDTKYDRLVTLDDIAGNYELEAEFNFDKEYIGNNTIRLKVTNIQTKVSSLSAGLPSPGVAVWSALKEGEELVNVACEVTNDKFIEKNQTPYYLLVKKSIKKGPLEN